MEVIDKFIRDNIDLPKIFLELKFETPERDSFGEHVMIVKEMFNKGLLNRLECLTLIFPYATKNNFIEIACDKFIKYIKDNKIDYQRVSDYEGDLTTDELKIDLFNYIGEYTNVNSKVINTTVHQSEVSGELCIMQTEIDS